MYVFSCLFLLQLFDYVNIGLVRQRLWHSQGLAVAAQVLQFPMLKHRKLPFSAEVVRKLKFPNNSILINYNVA